MRTRNNGKLRLNFGSAGVFLWRNYEAKKTLGAFVIGTILFAVAAFFYIREVPSIQPLFRLEYTLAASKTGYLQSYHDKIWKHSGGYISLPVQQFLCLRLESSKSNTEIQAIADFYASQALGREYGPLAELSDPAQIRLIDALFHHLPTEPLHSRLRSLFLIEEVRRGEMIGKGYFYVVDYPRFAHYLKKHPGRRKGHEAEEVFQEVLLRWWKSNPSPTQKLRQDPLRVAGMKIDGI